MVNYIDYRSLRKFYSLHEACELLGLSRSELRCKCAQYGIATEKDRVGITGLYRPKIRRLHNKLYYEGRMQQEKGGPRA